jgi:hypothetical protein
MASEFLDILMGKFSGASSAGSTSSLEQQQTRDMVKGIQDLNQILVKHHDAIYKSNQLIQEGYEPTAMKASQKVLEESTFNRLQNTLEKAILESKGGSEWEASRLAGREAKRLMSLDTEKDITKEQERFFTNLRNTNQEFEKAKRPGGMFGAVSAGIGGATLMHGLLGGNIIQAATGAGTIFGGISSEYKAAKAADQGGILALLGIGAKRLGVATLVAGGVALNEAQKQGEKVIPEGLSMGIGFESAIDMGTRGLGRGGAGYQQLISAGQVGGTNILTTQQQQQALEMFVRSGAGTFDQFKSVINDFAKYTTIYGEAGISLVQASRNLQMWIPEGDIGRSMEVTLNKLRQAGVPQALQIEGMNAFSNYGKNIALMEPENAKIETMRAAESFVGANQKGLYGQTAVNALSQINQGFAGAISNPQQFSALIAAGISPRRVFQIASGSAISTQESSQLNTFLQKSTSELPGFVSEYVQEMMIPMTGGKEGAQFIRRQGQQLARPKGTEEVDVAMQNIRRNAETGSIQKAISQRRGLEYRIEGLGFDENMRALYSTSTGLRNQGENMVEAMTWVAGNLRRVGEYLDTLVKKHFKMPSLNKIGIK